MKFKSNDEVRRDISAKANKEFQVRLNKYLSDNFREGNKEDRRDLADKAYQEAYEVFLQMAATRQITTTGWNHPEVEEIMDNYREEEEPEVDEFGQSFLNVSVEKGTTVDNRVRPKAAKI